MFWSRSALVDFSNPPISIGSHPCFQLHSHSCL
jgi:hypothetical protein